MAFCYVVCTMRVGPNVATFDLRLYLREKTRRRFNRHRPKEQRLPFRSKYRIARQILADLASLLPQGWNDLLQSFSLLLTQPNNVALVHLDTSREERSPSEM